MTAPTLEAERAAPCPFCGQPERAQHLPTCWFLLRDLGASRARLAQAWNRRTAAPVAEDVALPPKQSIGDDPEFKKLMAEYGFAGRVADHDHNAETVAAMVAKYCALIAYIDGRTAGTAEVVFPEKLRNEIQLIGEQLGSAVKYSPYGSGKWAPSSQFDVWALQTSVRLLEIAAAPLPLPPKEEAK